MARQKPSTHSVDFDERIVTSADLHGRDDSPGILPWHRATTYEMVRRGEFPPPIQFTAALRGWRWSTIRAWLDEREQHPIQQRAYFSKKSKATAEPVATEGR